MRPSSQPWKTKRNTNANSRASPRHPAMGRGTLEMRVHAQVYSMKHKMVMMTMIARHGRKHAQALQPGRTTPYSTHITEQRRVTQSYNYHSRLPLA